MPTSPHHASSPSVPLQAKTLALPALDDSVVYHINGVLASAAQAESLGVYDVPRTMLLQQRVDGSLRGPIEFWITTDKAKQDAGLEHMYKRPAIGFDPARGLREKMQVDSAARASMVQPTHAMTFSGRVLIDGRRATMLTLDRLPPDRIQSIEIMKSPDSAKVIKVTTKSH